MASHSSGDVRRPRIPHAFVLIFLLLIFTAVLSQLVRPGSYERQANGRVRGDTFAYDADSSARPSGLGFVFAVLQAPLRGLESAAAVIAFILIVGGAFRVVEETGALSAALRSSVRYLGRTELAFIPISMFLFSLGGAVLGMGEETLAFVLLFVPIARLFGFHPVVGVAVPLIGSQVGFAAAMAGPFSPGVAQSIAGIPPMSGFGFRSALWLVVTVAGVVFVSWQARRSGYDTETLDPDMVLSPHSKIRVTAPQIRVLVALTAGFILVVWGAKRSAWNVTETGAVFLAVGLVAGIVGGLTANRVARCFAAGARNLATAALTVGAARGIVVLAAEMRILDTLLFNLTLALEHAPAFVVLHVMFVFQSALNFFVPSGTGQAALTLPILAPLAESVGLTRQMAVLAFQLGDGFSNVILPTSAVLMGSLEAGKVSYARWFRFAWQLQLWLFLVGAAALSAAYAIGLGP